MPVLIHSYSLSGLWIHQSSLPWYLEVLMKGLTSLGCLCLYMWVDILSLKICNIDFFFCTFDILSMIWCREALLCSHQLEVLCSSVWMFISFLYIWEFYIIKSFQTLSMPLEFISIPSSTSGFLGLDCWVCPRGFRRLWSCLLIFPYVCVNVWFFLSLSAWPYLLTMLPVVFLIWLADPFNFRVSVLFFFRVSTSSRVLPCFKISSLS